MNTAAVDIQDVLLVEDSPTQALLLKESLESHHMKVRVANDGVEALEQMRQTLPQVVISDIAMPRMNGFDFCTHVRAEPEFASIPVILLTGLTDPMDVIKGIACGADSFLTKPCELNFLLSTIHDVVSNKQVRKERAPGQALAFFYNGKHHVLHIDQVQITNLLLSTYLNAIQKNAELEQSLSKLNQVYEEIKKKNDELKRLNDQKNQFLGMAAHDLRNPLGVVIGCCNLLKTRLENNIDEKSSRMLDKINTSSSFMLGLINDLLDVSVIESGTVSLHLDDVSLNDLIQDNLVFLKSLAEKKNIQLNFKSKNVVPKISCDPNKISQVLNNLITNAIKFSRPGGIVDVTLESSSTEITITVSDFGTGISQDAQQLLFMPFTQGRMGTAGEKSTGLGLSIVQKIVSKHNGKIWLDSKVGKGTKFFVSLPRTAPTHVGTPSPKW